MVSLKFEDADLRVLSTLIGIAKGHIGDLEAKILAQLTAHDEAMKPIAEVLPEWLTTQQSSTPELVDQL